MEEKGLKAFEYVGTSMTAPESFFSPLKPGEDRGGV
jgi:hypothetical protein